MNLADRIKLVDDMVRENHQVTIKEYLELVDELEKIERSRKPFINVIQDRYKDLRNEFIRT